MLRFTLTLAALCTLPSSRLSARSLSGQVPNILAQPEQALHIVQTALAARNPDAIAPPPSQNPVAGRVAIRTA